MYEAFLKLADKKGQVFDYDLEALAFIDMQQGDEDRLVLDKLSAHSTKEYPATAFVQVELDGKKLSTSSIGGNGPVDAVYNAILNLTGLEIKMSHYNLTAKGRRAEALGQVDIVVNMKAVNSTVLVWLQNIVGIISPCLSSRDQRDLSFS